MGCGMIGDTFAGVIVLRRIAVFAPDLQGRCIWRRHRSGLSLRR
jgi:hypothetical protein